MFKLFCRFFIFLSGSRINYFSFTCTGKEDWSGKCAIGRRQSPVDLAEDASVLGQFSPLTFINYDNDVKNGKVRNSGHSSEYIFFLGKIYMVCLDAASITINHYQNH